MIFYDPVIEYLKERKNRKNFLVLISSISLITFICATILPGFLFFFFFEKELFVELTSLNIISVSVLYAFPVYMINLIMFFFIIKDDRSATRIALSTLLAGFITIDVIYISLIISYFFGKDIFVLLATAIIMETVYLASGLKSLLIR